MAYVRENEFRSPKSTQQYTRRVCSERICLHRRCRDPRACIYYSTQCALYIIGVYIVCISVYVSVRVIPYRSFSVKELFTTFTRRCLIYICIHHHHSYAVFVSTIPVEIHMTVYYPGRFYFRVRIYDIVIQPWQLSAYNSSGLPNVFPLPRLPHQLSKYGNRSQ